jgi:GntR family transcriptional regulator
VPNISLQLKDALAQDIEQGKYQAGDILPSETELIKTWSVSRITVRNAIKKLALEGLVYTVHGRGTFVSEQKITNYLPSLTSLSHDVAKKGMVPGSRVLYLQQIAADKTAAARLHLAPGGRVIYFVRLHLADDKPIAMAYTYLSIAAIVPHQDRFTPETLEKGSFYGLLEEIGVNLSGGIQSISAVGATAEQAGHLQVETGSPLIESERVSFIRDKTPVEFTRMLSRPDLIQWKVLLGPMSKDGRTAMSVGSYVL